MINIFVCEDDLQYRSQIANTIDNYLLAEKLNMQIALATASPYVVLDFIKNTNTTGLYFLDLDLGCDINGIQLAKAIRDHDPRGFIVFVTTDAESHMLTFKYKVEAMDYIVKGDIKLASKICDCIANAHALFTSNPTQQNKFTFKLSKDTKNQLSRGSTIALNFDEILYFATSPDASHSISVFTKTSKQVFRGKLSDILKRLDQRFFRCHRSCIVNIDKVIAIDADSLKLKLDGGNFIYISAKYIKKIEMLMDKK